MDWPTRHKLNPLGSSFTDSLVGGVTQGVTSSITGGLTVDEINAVIQKWSIIFGIAFVVYFIINKTTPQSIIIRHPRTKKS